MDALRYEQVEKSLKGYRENYPEEEEVVTAFKELLNKEGCFLRKTYPAHFTGSAWIVDPDLKKVLLIHHPKLKKWLQPGGHIENDELPWETAVREVSEEVGLEVELFQDEEGVVVPLDIDCHYIPAKGDEKEHWHYDFRYLAIAKEGNQIGGGEGIEMRWFDFSEVCEKPFEASLMRMVSKCFNVGYAGLSRSLRSDL